MINAVGSKNLVFIQVKVKKGKKQEISDILNGPDGIPTTAAFDGCLGYDMAWNEDSYSFHLVGNWESYEKYAAYLNWRQTEDSTIGTMVPFLRGGADGLVIYQPNSDYASF
jgi:quinol monooxygenase YgiN